MEFEILNEIMTSTVSQLFTMNRSSHMKYFKNSSQLNESRIDIPMGRASTSNLLMPDGTPNQLFGPNAAAEQQVNTLTQSEWVNTKGKKFLEDSKERLQIDTRNYLFRNQQLSQLSYEELNKIKRNVKGELKKYDQLFQQIFQKNPAKTDKEPLRPLYMYYKKLKQLIDTAYKRMRQGGGSMTNPVVSNATAQNVITTTNNQAQLNSNAATLSTTGNAGSRAHSASSQQSKTSFTISSTGGNSNMGSRDNSLSGPVGDLQNINQYQQRAGSAGQSQTTGQGMQLKNQQPQDQQRQASLTMQDLTNGVSMGGNAQTGFKKSSDNVLQQNNNKYNQQVTSQQQTLKQTQDQGVTGKTMGSRKNSTGTTNHSAQNSLGQMDKDSQGRLMGVRGSVELKSINSVGGLQNVLGNGPQGGAQNGGFMYQQSKHQPMNQKSQTQKTQDMGNQPIVNGTTGGYSQQQQYSKAEMNNVRKSAQAVTMGSLLDNNLNYPDNKQSQQVMYNRQQQQQQYQQQPQQAMKNGQVQQQQQQFKQGGGVQYQQYDPRTQQNPNQYLMQQQQQPQPQINFYHQPANANDRKENINSQNPHYGTYEEQKNMGSAQLVQNSNNLIGGGSNQVNLAGQKGKEKRPNSASVGSSQQMLNQQQMQQAQPVQQNGRARQMQQTQQQILDINASIEEFKKERGVLRQTLDTFRRDFERTNARKIKFKKDIKAVEGEFKRYKDLKDEIHRLEKQLTILSQGNGGAGNSIGVSASVGGIRQ
eukprot:403331446